MNWFMRMLGERSRAGVSARRQATRLRLEELEDRFGIGEIFGRTCEMWMCGVFTGS